MQGNQLSPCPAVDVLRSYKSEVEGCVYTESFVDWSIPPLPWSYRSRLEKPMAAPITIIVDHVGNRIRSVLSHRDAGNR